MKPPLGWAFASLAATLLACAIPAVALPLRSAQVSSGMGQIIDQVLSWLPADTESVAAARGPFSIGLNKDNENEDRSWFTRKASQAEIWQAFENLPLELFYDLDLDTPLRGSIVAFAMQGSRHFRKPLAGLEVMSYEGCSIVIFENKPKSLQQTLLRTLVQKSVRAEVVAGARVLVFHEKSGKAELDYFLAIPRPNVLLVANNFQYLEEVLERMTRKKDARALPNQLPEWRYLDPAVRFWGMRHYDRTQTKLDPTSPFGDNKAFNPGDPKAIGVVFALDPKNPRRVIITSFSGEEASSTDEAKTESTVAEPQEGVKFEVKRRSPEPGVLEEVYTVDRYETLDYVILIVLVTLGRGAYL